MYNEQVDTLCNMCPHGFNKITKMCEGTLVIISENVLVKFQANPVVVLSGTFNNLNHFNTNICC